MVFINKKILINDLEFCLFKPSEFEMGKLAGDINASYLEKQRKITITKKFHLQTKPVTTKQYTEFINDTKYDTDYHIEIWNGEWVLGPHFWDVNGRGDDFPVVGVSYIDANNYMEWASNKYDKDFRFPTEAEFEYASKLDCNCFTYCKQAIIAQEKGILRKFTAEPVDGPLSLNECLVNKSGLYGMNGSLWQWCSDWFFYYSLDQTIDPQGPSEMPTYAPWNGEKWAPGKVIRGGSFSYPFEHARCSNRHYSKINDRNYNVGFRLCF